MKETHLFYAPDIAARRELPADEAVHAVRVLRMREGDTLTLTDGKGRFYEGEVTLASPKRCAFSVTREWEDAPLWRGGIHLAVAPTKNMDRMEWLVEKATEIGVDRVTLLLCENSERRVVKTERLEKIAVSAMKQSHKARKPLITEMTSLSAFLDEMRGKEVFIAHCHDAAEAGEGGEEAELRHLSGRNFLGDLLSVDGESCVLIGPEGDFSEEEVTAALAAGCRPVSLGESRLRTETAALVAVHLMYLSKRAKA